MHPEFFYFFFIRKKVRAIRKILSCRLALMVSIGEIYRCDRHQPLKRAVRSFVRRRLFPDDHIARYQDKIRLFFSHRRKKRLIILSIHMRVQIRDHNDPQFFRHFFTVKFIFRHFKFFQFLILPDQITQKQTQDYDHKLHKNPLFLFTSSILSCFFHDLQ